MDHEQRLRSLRGLTKLLFAAGLVLAAIPFIASVMPDSGNSARQPSPWEVDVDLRTLAAGDMLAIDWPGGPVQVLHRTPGQIAALQAGTVALSDADSVMSEQPANAHNALRSEQPRYFVFIARETLRGCSIRPASANSRWPEGFDEACEGSRYDLAGRRIEHTGNNGQKNLTVPPHRFTGPQQLQLTAP